MEEINPLEYTDVVWDTTASSQANSMPAPLPALPAAVAPVIASPTSFQPSSTASTSVPTQLPINLRTQDVSRITSFNLASSSPLIVTISDPQKHGEGMKDAYVSYLISTKKPPANQETAVRRRFTDFVYLHSQISREFPACIVPPLPDKHRMEYITGDRFSAEFVEKRRASLQRFVNRIARHPVIQKSPDLHNFLTASDWNIDALSKSKKETVFDNLSDTLLNAFSKLKKPDERFIEIKESILKLEENLASIERIYGKVIKKHIDIEQDYSEFGAGLTSLGIMESDVTEQLTKVGGIFYEFSKAMNEMIQQEDVEFAGHVREYLAYCQSVKYTLKLRDQKQLDYEELQDFLAKTQFDKDKLIQFPNGTGGIGNYIKEKYEEIKGIDHETARREKLVKLDAKINELQEAVEVSKQVSQGFSSEVAKEIDFFQSAKSLDFKQFLGSYAKGQIEFYRKSLELWESMVPVMEGVEVDTGITQKGVSGNEIFTYERRNEKSPR